MRGAARFVTGTGVFGFLVAVFVAKGQRNGAHHQDAGEEERERSFHALAVGGGREKSQVILMALSDHRPLSAVTRAARLIGLRINRLVAIRLRILDAVPAVIAVLGVEGAVLLSGGYVVKTFAGSFLDAEAVVRSRSAPARGASASDR